MNQQTTNQCSDKCGAGHCRGLIRAGTTVLLVLAFFLALKSVNAVVSYQYIGQDVEPQRTVQVSGEGEVFAIPDTATFRATVVEEAESADAAQDAASERMSEAIDVIKEAGVAEKDIKTVSYRSNPRYEYESSRSIPRPPRGDRTLVGYEVRHTIEVKVEERDKAGEIIGSLSDIGVQQVSNVQMTIDDTDELKADAREKAIADAKTKAARLAEDLGVDLERVVSFNESGGDIPRPYMMEAAARGGKGGGDDSAPTPLPAGESKITSNVTITYEIR